VRAGGIGIARRHSLQVVRLARVDDTARTAVTLVTVVAGASHGIGTRRRNALGIIVTPTVRSL